FLHPDFVLSACIRARRPCGAAPRAILHDRVLWFRQRRTLDSRTPPMNLPSTLFALRWLAWDTFRQSLAARSFWLLLALSGLCIVFCLGVGITGKGVERPPGEIELYGGDDQPFTGL